MFVGLGEWFAQRGIDTEGLTLILNFRDWRAASAFDVSLHHEIDPLMLYRAEKPMFDADSFRMAGIEIRIESPIHGHKATAY